jgi:hypothetical protein
LIFNFEKYLINYTTIRKNCLFLEEPSGQSGHLEDLLGSAQKVLSFFPASLRGPSRLGIAQKAEAARTYSLHRKINRLKNCSLVKKLFRQESSCFLVSWANCGEKEREKKQTMRGFFGLFFIEV